MSKDNSSPETVNGLTAGQLEYFTILEGLGISDSMRREIEITKSEILEDNATEVVRGRSRVQGFSIN